MTEISDEEIEAVINRLVKEGRLIRITMPNGEPGVRLVKRERKDEDGSRLRD